MTKLAIIIVTIVLVIILFMAAVPVFSAETDTASISNMQIKSVHIGNKCGIHINNKCYDIPEGAHSISMTGDKMFVDGKPYDFPNAKQITINIIIDGEVGSIQGADTVTINGNAKTVDAPNGSITAQSIIGNATADNGSITVNGGSIGGDVQAANGQVTANNIQGYVSAPNGRVEKSFRK